MSYKEVCRFLGNYLLYFTIVLCIPLIIALYYEFIENPIKNLQPNSSLAFLETIVICLAIGFIFKFIGRRAKHALYKRESILLVVLIWLITAFVSSLPFTLSNTLDSHVDAYFEAMSGLTTTGSTVMCAKAYDNSGKEILLEDTNVHVPFKKYTYYGTIKPVIDKNTGKTLFTGVEAVSKAVLFWRSFIQWLGGMGIVILFLAVLPSLAVGGRFLYQMEVPGPTKDALRPRIKETASILWKLYLFLTILQIVLLIWTNPEMQLLDAFCITFSTLSTGGFSIKNASIGAYHSAWTDWIVIIFMFLGSVNFVIYFHILKKKIYKVFEPDFLLFFIIIIIGSILVTGFFYGNYSIFSDQPQTNYTLAHAIRTGTFQAVSAQTSTGFVTANYDLWPFPSQLIMLILMFIGGMAGSTCGGIKTSRYYLLSKTLFRKIESIFRPDLIHSVKAAGQEIDTNTQMTVMAFFCIALFFTVLGTTALVLNGIDPETSIGSIACMMNNIGIAFRAAGPTSSFAFFPVFSKIVSIIWMLLGRLEFFAVILLFLPSFWKSK
jgi:trk system potassium uptake protein